MPLVKTSQVSRTCEVYAHVERYMDSSEMITSDHHIPSRSTAPTIGALVGNLTIPYQFDVWSGIRDAAHNKAVNLLCFRGERLPVPFDRTKGFHPSSYYTLYDLISDRLLDGLIIVGTAAFLDSTAEVTALCAYYRPLPIVTLVASIPGIHSIQVDNAHGIKMLVRHLIDVHQFRRIAFITGPEGNEEAAQRYHAYVETLKEADIPIDPRLIVPGNFVKAFAIQSVQNLLDKSNLRPQTDVEAIVAANDESALGVIEVLQQRGFRVPQDIAVVGFDNIASARITTPPLTTVQQPVYEEGYQAVETLCQLLNRAAPAEMVRLPTTLIVRQSCGCQMQAVTQAEAIRHAPASISGDMPPRFADVFAAHRDVLLNTLQSKGTWSDPSQARQWLAQMLDAFAADLTGSTTTAFVNTLEDILGDLVPLGAQEDIWHSLLSHMRQQVLPLLPDEMSVVQAEKLWQQARVMMTTREQRGQMAQIQRMERQIQRLSAFGQIMMAAVNVDDLMQVLERELPQLKIPGCYLALYENPEDPTGAARLVFAYNHTGRIRLAPEGIRFPAEQLIPQGFWPENRVAQYVVSSLHFQQERLGFVLWEIGPHTGMIYESLQTQICNALKGQQLLQEQERTHHILALQPILEHLIVVATQLGHAPDQLTEISGQMAAGAAQTMQQASMVSARTQQIKQIVTAMSGAVKEEASNIQEISGSISKVTAIITNAVELANSANMAMEELARHSQETGNVLKVITEIAEQTELLALNATIKAAQARELGKGFAVIASHVKDLAADVARSSEEIECRIKTMQDTRRQAADAMAQVVHTIQQVAELFQIVVTSTVAQSATTHEISQTITDVARESSAITEVMATLVATSQQFSAQAARIQHEAQELPALAEQLRQLTQVVTRSVTSDVFANNDTV